MQSEQDLQPVNPFFDKSTKIVLLLIVVPVVMCFLIVKLSLSVKDHSTRIITLGIAIFGPIIALVIYFVVILPILLNYFL